MSDVAARIAELGPWFHNLNLDGIETAPNHPLGDYPSFKFEGFKSVLPDDLSGRSVLDIGCNAGFYAIEMWRRGADRVLGIDNDPRYLAQARLAAEVTGAKIDLRQMSVYDIWRLEERFDLLIDRAAWFEPPMQRLVAFARSPALAERAAALSGYDTTCLGDVLWNA